MSKRNRLRNSLIEANSIRMEKEERALVRTSSVTKAFEATFASELQKEHTKAKAKAATKVASQEVAQAPKPTITLSLDHMNELVAIDASGHSFNVPLTIEGVRMLKSLLVVKSDASSNSTRANKLGSLASPTQEQVLAFLKNKELEKEEERIKEANELKEMF